ncbi:MAG: KTSC domain-containing protein [Anaerolineae bacterium]|nr:KTSC domain-containing protein [Anaerolineae bacterium]MCZ2113478.1 KTSC domain-containing protein [Anaerolineae bacterium]
MHVIGYDVGNSSSNIDALGWDGKIGLVVVFKNGDRYRYESIPKSIFDRIMRREIDNSYGKTFNALCKSGQKWTKLKGFVFSKVLPASAYGQHIASSPEFQSVLNTWISTPSPNCPYAW